MRYHFHIEYERADGERVETLSSTDDRAVLHALLDEYLDTNIQWSGTDEGIHFEVSSACTCHEQRPKRSRRNA